jgi:hypothetical protein
MHDKPAKIEMVTLKQLWAELKIDPREARERLRLLLEAKCFPRQAIEMRVLRVVPRGGLRQVNKLNDLRKSGTLDLSIQSLCFLARVSHHPVQRGP